MPPETSRKDQSQLPFSRERLVAPLDLWCPALLSCHPLSSREKPGTSGFCRQRRESGCKQEPRSLAVARDDKTPFPRKRTCRRATLRNFRRVDLPYRIASINVTLLISFSVVIPNRTLSSADSRRKRMPSSRAARRISDVGFLARIISRMRSLKSSSS